MTNRNLLLPRITGIVYPLITAYSLSFSQTAPAKPRPAKESAATVSTKPELVDLNSATKNMQSESKIFPEEGDQPKWIMVL